ncbi:hypothetical protein LTR64_006104 [Lithohypha guttulata]|uniref:uncharacterized protein n=1 Tax=Lithohypha guttulata TaxID=1690604 RepID=UPI002DDF66E3|nr:hypothetical protein LTR51_002098 [Lithohypha guttulata]
MAHIVQTATPTNDGASNNTTYPVSARVMKKRETDRRCQRMIRERTKSKIAYLEDLVEQFRQQDASGRVETLMRQLEDAQEERDSLAKKVKNIESIISDSSKVKEEPEVRESSVPKLKDNSHPSSPSIDVQQTTASHSPVEDLTTENLQELPLYAIHNKEYSAYVDSSSRSSWSASTLHADPSHRCDCSAHSSALDPTKTLNKWRYANDTLTEWFKWSPQALDMSKYLAYNDDIPVRAMVEGWDAVEKHGHMHPAWRLLRGIDETLFKTCEPRERLAILTVMGLLLQAHLNPTTEQHKKLPAFYIKRPSQDMLHSYATEYFAWPGLRERFVFSEHRYCSNSFWSNFCSSLRIQWPYEFRDCYTRNTETGLYKISPTFQERVTNIRAWTMSMGMFKQYPELYADIPACDHIPASLAPPSSRKSSRTILTITPAIADSDEDHSETQPTHPEGGRMQISDLARQGQVTQPGPGIYMAPSSVSPFDPITASLPNYAYSSTDVATPVTGFQHMPATQHWNYMNNLDMFQLNPA